MRSQCPRGLLRDVLKLHADQTQPRPHLETRIGDISLGGRSKNLDLDPLPWKPNINVVRATIRYAIATGRLLADEQVLP